MSEIRLTRALGADAQIVRNMFVGYFYDMSQYDDNLIINDYGLPMWAPFGLPGPRTAEECVSFNWWIRDRCELYVIRAGGSPAGFVIICADAAHLPDGVEYELMDFYVAPRYRRQGVGRRAARLALDLHRGAWVVYQLARNAPALRFWHALVADYTGGDFTMLDEGTQQRFNNTEALRH
ncbi:GNAT family N-acetyltransferase [Oscillochloris sp. ZM17-4]|uniref:GNAT family N-acetyltransferase n=1 Tax=Oscillochloris sp. ZM17-4 TaxID=2866714 RepID=UPI001C739717|nr:GNAT family N-acetyltransferase [Oscillochloris sp. ZM17-4]MBX0328281.1 GNAT family N-acetyltransferase [Oscillochloris sp. ZM17-4]